MQGILSNYPTIQLSNYPTIQLSNYPTIQLTFNPNKFDGPVLFVNGTSKTNKDKICKYFGFDGSIELRKNRTNPSPQEASQLVDRGNLFDQIVSALEATPNLSVLVALPGIQNIKYQVSINAQNQILLSDGNSDHSINLDAYLDMYSAEKLEIISCEGKRNNIDSRFQPFIF